MEDSASRWHFSAEMYIRELLQRKLASVSENLPFDVVEDLLLSRDYNRCVPCLGAEAVAVWDRRKELYTAKRVAEGSARGNEFVAMTPGLEILLDRVKIVLKEGGEMLDETKKVCGTRNDNNVCEHYRLDFHVLIDDTPIFSIDKWEVDFEVETWDESYVRAVKPDNMEITPEFNYIYKLDVSGDVMREAILKYLKKKTSLLDGDCPPTIRWIYAEGWPATESKKRRRE